MSKKCVSCGKELDSDAAVCDLCSAPQPVYDGEEPEEESVKENIEVITEEIPEEPVEETAEETEDGESDKKEKDRKSDRPLAKKRALIIGIPAVLVAAALTVLICFIAGSTYQHAVKKFCKGYFGNKPGAYVDSVSALKYYGYDAHEFYENKKLVVQNELINATQSYVKEIGKIKKVSVKFGKREKKDSEYLDMLILLSGADANKDGIKASEITKPYTVDLTVTLTGKEGDKMLSINDLFICKENGEWKVYKSFETDVYTYELEES